MVKDCINGIHEIYILLSEDSPPLFMVLEDKSKPLCFPFTADIPALSKALNFDLEIG